MSARFFLIPALCLLTLAPACGPDGPYEPCGGKAEGDKCQLCGPHDGNCVETMDLKVCNAAGKCGGKAPKPATAQPPDASVPDSGKIRPACVTTFPATPKIALPKDEARHGDFFEWWYWTGHLETAGGRPFGFQLTFFESTPRPGIPFGSGTMAHFAVTDVQAGVFMHDYRFAAPAAYPQQSGRFRVANDTWWAEGTTGAYSMHAEMEGYTLDLSLEDEKRAVFHFADGFVTYPAPYAGYTYYGSRPRLRAKGTVTTGGAAQAVSGEVWMDQQWGQPPQTEQPFPLPPLVETNYGWSWFQFQLETGEELMLVNMRVKDGTFLSTGTWVGKDCSFEALDAKAFTVESLGTWTSPHTGVVYPQNWRVKVPGKSIELEAKAVLADQEIYKHGSNPLVAVVAPSYWEGKVDVTGTGPGGAALRGNGYAESVGGSK